MFERHLISRNVAEATRKRYLRETRQFFEISTLEDIRDLTREGVYAYITALQNAVNTQGGSRFSPPVIAGMLSTLRVLCTFLYRCDYLITNPFDGAPVQLHGNTSCRQDISAAQMNRFLSAIETATELGMRDRTIFEMLYATGLRIGELTALNVEDIDPKKRLLVVRKGKGNRERIVPLMASVLNWLETYITHTRKTLLALLTETQDGSALFLSMKGRRLSCSAIEERAKHYSQKIMPDEARVTPHIFRHSFASHLLMNGASVKDVSVLLGHSSIESTVGYTHFTVHSLKKIMKQYHPLENELYTEEGRLAELRAILQLGETI